MKKLLIVGQCYDMAQPKDSIVKSVTSDLYYIYGKGQVKFDFDVEPDGIRLIFYRQYGDFYTPTAERTQHPGETDTFSWDFHILMGVDRKDYPTIADFQHYPWRNIFYPILGQFELSDYRKEIKGRHDAITGIECHDDREKVEYKIFV